MEISAGMGRNVPITHPGRCGGLEDGPAGEAVTFFLGEKAEKLLRTEAHGAQANPSGNWCGCISVTRFTGEGIV